MFRLVNCPRSLSWSFRSYAYVSPFAPNKANVVAHQTNITYASQFIQCLCDGSKENEVMGTEAMEAAVSTCSTCVTTPSIIVADLQVSAGLVSC